MSVEESYIEKVTKGLEAPFPEEAYIIDNSRGFKLAGIRNAYVVERLNKVFGLIGYGWRYVVGEHKLVTVKKKTGEVEHVILELALQYRVDGEGSSAVIYSTLDGWEREPSSPKVWSEPVFAFGGSAPGPGSVPLTDAMKGAVSDALSKAASKLGVAMDAYKGRVQIDGNQVHAEQAAQDTTNPDTILALLKGLLLTSPEMAQSVLENDAAVKQVFTDNILVDFVNFAKENDLFGFVKDNLKTIIKRKITRLDDLSATEVMFVWDMCEDIVASEEFTWEKALEVSASWDQVSSWREHLKAASLENG